MQALQLFLFLALSVLSQTVSAASFDFAPPQGFIAVDTPTQAKPFASWRDASGRWITAIHIEGSELPEWTQAQLVTALPKISRARATVLGLSGITNYVTSAAKVLAGKQKRATLMHGSYQDINGKQIRFSSLDVPDRDGFWTVAWTEPATLAPKLKAVESSLQKFRLSAGQREPAQEYQLRKSLTGEECDTPKATSSVKGLSEIASKIEDQNCSRVPASKRRRADSDSYYSGFWGTTQWVLDTKTLPAFAVGCAQGVADVAIEFVTGMIDLVKTGAYLTIDPQYRAQVASSMNLVWASAKNDKTAFAKKILASLWESMKNSASDWLGCMHARAQFEQTCKMLTMITPAMMAMIITFGPKAFTMMNGAKSALASLRAGALTEVPAEAKLASVAKEIAPPAPPAPKLPAPQLPSTDVPKLLEAPKAAAVAEAPKAPAALEAPKPAVVSPGPESQARLLEKFKSLQVDTQGLGQAGKDRALSLIRESRGETVTAMKTIVDKGGKSDLQAVLESAGSNDQIAQRIQLLSRETKLSPKDNPALKATGEHDPPARSVLDLPRATEFPLPPDFKAAVESHKIARLRETYGDGAGLAINLSHYTDNGVIYAGNFGESIQSQMIAKTLKEVFPKATIFRSDDPAAQAGKKILNLRIRDSAETNASIKDGLEMTVLKAANPGAAAFSKAQLREKLGIAPNKFVATIYSQKRAAWGDLVKSVSQYRKPDVVFLTAGGTTADSLMSASVKPLSELGYKVIKLSEFDAADVASGQRYAVINDLAGRMPHLYNASDLAVVRGPINFIEPLSTGTKTVFMVDDISRGRYREVEFKQLVQTATATGGGFAANGNAELTKSVARALNSTQPITPPYLVSSGRNQASSVVKYLDELNSALEMQAKPAPAPPRLPSQVPLIKGSN